MKRLLRGAAWSALGLSLACNAQAPPRANDADANLAGFWWGEIGSARERVGAGLEFLRKDGEWQVLLTQPGANYYDMPIATATVEGNHIVAATAGLDLTLVDGRLQGSFPGPKSPASLARGAEKPREVPIPSLPTGTGPAWHARIGGQVYASPAVDGSLVVVGSTAGVMTALDGNSGEIRWAFAAGCPIVGDAAIAGDVLFFCDDGALYRIKRDDGTLVWRVALQDVAVKRVLPHPATFGWERQAAAPRVQDGIVYIGAPDGSLHALAYATGKSLWKSTCGSAGRNVAEAYLDDVTVGKRGGKVSDDIDGQRI
jgi:hypothetical protein